MGKKSKGRRANKKKSPIVVADDGGGDERQQRFGAAAAPSVVDLTQQPGQDGEIIDDQQQVLLDNLMWRTLVGVCEQDSIQCSHICSFICAGPAVTNFIDSLMEYRRSKKGIAVLEETFKHHCEVWDDATHRHTVICILVIMGTNLVLLGEWQPPSGLGQQIRMVQSDGVTFAVDYASLAQDIAYYIMSIEQYDGECSLYTTKLKTARICTDMKTSGEREVVRFFSKRIICPCLKAI